ncbi:MAG TPA: hypothetical protein VGG75_38445 [Trebonia sp.]|jgi:hypothetical protein
MERVVLPVWLVLMLGMPGFMIVMLVSGYPQGLAMIFVMVIMSWVAGQILEDLSRGNS